MLEWIFINKQWIFGGIGVTICVGIITGIFSLIRKIYKNYTITRWNEYVSLEKLKKDLKYDKDNGIFYKINSNNEKEIYCPLCLENDKKLFRLVVDKLSADGNLFKCNRCGKTLGKGFRKPIYIK